MIIRKYNQGDCKQICRLFYDTVHSVCCNDYNEKQIDAWAKTVPDEKAWNEGFLKSYTIVCEEDDIIIGFGDILNDYLDRLYVHKDYQHLGVGGKIVDELEQQALRCGILDVTTHASVTALPFFKSRGYELISQQTVVRHEVSLTNYIMHKRLTVQ